MDIYEKLAILSDSAKYDVSCSSSGAESNFQEGMIGCNYKNGICHTFTEDGRCVSLLKVLFTNFCIYDCSYCINRQSNDRKRAAFSPRELADLTINFYKRNYIEGLFLSSGIFESEDKTMQLLIKALEILRFEYRFNGYIHVKLIPGACALLIQKVCQLATRVSSNLELPSAKSLKLLAPDKTQKNLMQPLKYAKDFTQTASKKPIPMSTQLIIGATPESDFDILKLSSNLYDKALLKIYKKVKKLNAKYPKLLGKKTIFGVMPDWNPAEIIGLRPKKLALSLYRELITDNIWAKQRDKYGYLNLRSHPLIVSFLGLPYVDVRVSFNSFIPKSLDLKISERLVDFYINKLAKNPHLHDRLSLKLYSLLSILVNYS